MSNLAPFRPYKKPRKVNLDELAHVLSQMQGLLDTVCEEGDEKEAAFRGLVRQWHAMLQSALVDAAKRTH